MREKGVKMRLLGNTCKSQWRSRWLRSSLRRSSVTGLLIKSSIPDSKA